MYHGCFSYTGASIPMGQGGHVPSPHNISEVMSFRLDLFYPVTATTVVCCILMQILCVVSQKGSASDPLPPLDLLGDFHPPDPRSSFMSPQ